MSIDHPPDAIQALNASDDRQRSPVSKQAKYFLEVAKLFAPPGAGFILGAAKVVADLIGRREEANRREFLDSVAEELKYRAGQIQTLVAESAEHRRFMEEEMPGLLLDAVRRAEQARARERIARMARILLRAAELGPVDGADFAEEMLRIAMDLDDRDVIVLREIDRAFAGCDLRGGRGKIGRTQVLQTWRFAVVNRLTLKQGEVLSVCLKLQSYGLIEAVEDRSKNNLDEEPLPFGLLQKGRAFVEYVRSAGEELNATTGS